MRQRALTVAIALLVLLLLLTCTVPHATRNAREREVLSTVLREASRYDVSPAMIMAIIRTESDFDKNAVSEVGAVGLMQLMPSTFSYLRDEKLGEALADSAIYDPAVNIRYGTYYYAYLSEQFGDPATALAAYNAGEGRVCEWLLDPSLSKDGVLTDIPFGETEHYVKATLAAYRYYLEKYNL